MSNTRARVLVGMTAATVGCLKYCAALLFLYLLSANGASAIEVEDETANGVPVIDPTLYTQLGNQSRFDSVVSFNETDFNSVTGRLSPPDSFGSGVLLSPNVVLTAAHVVDGASVVVTPGQNALSTINGLPPPPTLRKSLARQCRSRSARFSRRTASR